MAIWTWRKGTFSSREWGWQSPFNPRAAGLGPGEAGSWAARPGTTLGLSAVPSPVRSKSWPGDAESPFHTRKPDAPAALRSRASLERYAPCALWDLDWCARRPPRFCTARRARAGLAPTARRPEAAPHHLSPTEGSGGGLAGAPCRHPRAPRSSKTRRELSWRTAGRPPRAASTCCEWESRPGRGALGNGQRPGVFQRPKLEAYLRPTKAQKFTH